MSIKTIIIDDESFAREEIKHLLSYYNDFIIESEASNGIEAIKLIKNIKPDLIFMDIEMPGLKGIDIAELLYNDNLYKPYIVFITAYQNFAVEAFKYDIKDYLLKPIEPKRFTLCINKIISFFGTKFLEKTIIAKSSNKTTIIKQDEISFINIEEGVVYINTADKAYSTSYRTLDDLEKLLNASVFFRAHRSFIVNINKIREVKQSNTGILSLKIIDNNAKEIPVARSKVKDFKNLFKI